MLLEVIHRTHYHYPGSVGEARHVSCLQAVNRPGQEVLDFALHIHPAPAERHCAPDSFGNPRCHFALHAAHDSLEVTAHSRVRTQALALPRSTLPWERLREHLRYRAGQAPERGAEFIAASEMVLASPFVPRHSAFADYAGASFTPGRAALQACVELMQRIHSDFRYQSHSTDIHTPARQVLAQRHGVCQDFAHVLLACLRSLGLAARYVSGYLLTQVDNEAERLVGGDASHAWVAVYLPDLPEGCRWLDLDPTNNRYGLMRPGPDYITVATGRDFGDVSPLRGVIQGGAQHSLTVGVTVRPLPEPENKAPGHQPAEATPPGSGDTLGDNLR